MCRANIEPLLRFLIEPAIECPPARETQGVDRAIRIDHGNLKITLERRSDNGLPIYDNLGQIQQPNFSGSPNQSNNSAAMTKPATGRWSLS